MYLILIAWLYVTLMMAIAEATNPVGSVLGAIVTFVLYGLLPMGILAYIMGTPERKRRLHARRQQEQQAWDAQQTRAGHRADAGLPAAPKDAASGAANAAPATPALPADATHKEPPR